ncbi:cysteinyl-tRNA synthetase [Gemmobacter megaterium]|uniref:Cysteine--tRNA ligase n=1 Tax=Gemmobacter megaterium TaxID=1086013 RepID=A0A1N7M508_9RHOB|nr:cysteine--tRNA ligase [Gemmobacter megaterium]GGE08854.1 cysteine--tRNA ligase [Gemmobacter megaterium]SIS81168.1 cysteinyl-tRNA synthetase [Gemmobacter megaterium]
MARIRLRNTMTRKVEDFVPLDPGNVRMYVCGPTVYDRAHLGNARPVVVFDVLFRLLRHVYGEAAVTYVRNFTDVDDKINAKAAETGRPIRDITDETIAWYHADMDALGALRPTAEPRATEWIPAMVAMIEGLIAGGHAYAAEGHVLFRVRSFAAYGALSGRSVDDMIAGARVEVAPYKEDPMDFVLWKPSTGDQPGWESPWGVGRPGWHIECSAMSDGLLWEAMKDRLSPEALAAPHVFDIHGGGIDLQFPHHENEVAQSCCAHGAADPAKGFANYWLHNEMLLVEGKKMSKSLGNFFTVRELLDQGVPGEVIRYVFLMTHYSKPMDWTADKAREAEGVLRKWRRELTGVGPTLPAEPVRRSLSENLNTPLALAELNTLFNLWTFLKGAATSSEERSRATEIEGQFLASANLLGLLIDGNVPLFSPMDLAQYGLRLVTLRLQATATKDFSAVDALKSALITAGVEVRMSKTGVELVPGPGFDPAKLEDI